MGDLQVIFNSADSSVKTDSIARHDHHRVGVVSEYSDVPTGGEARFSRAKPPLPEMLVSEYSDVGKK